jgi:hypothetical protein
MRDKGKFVKGAKPGPGRGKSTKQMNYPDVFKEALTVDAAYRIVSKAVEQAERGDYRARDWLFRYVLKPQPRDLEIPRFVTDTHIVTESDKQRAFFDMALRSASSVEQCEFLLLVARKVEDAFTRRGEQDDGSRVGAELGEGGDGSPVAREVR